MTAGLSNALEGPEPLAVRLTAYAQTRLRFIEAAALMLAVAILLVSTLPNIANHPTITDDEMWVFSSAYKLATENVFGTDMFAGFHDADTRYFFNMPLHHIVIGSVMKVFGAGIIQARLVGVGYAIVTLLLTYLLARKLMGVPAAILSLGLLLCLRLNMGFDTGLPLQELAVNMRYDLAPVPLILGGVLVLLGGPSLKRSLIAGVIFGLAILMQFHAAFMFPVAMAFLWMEDIPRSQRLKLIGGLLAAAAIVGVPYGAYILTDLESFRGQAGTVDRRDDFDHQDFYVNSLKAEPDRFLRPLAIEEIPRGADHEIAEPQFLSLQETLQRRPSAKLAVLVGLPAALLLTGMRCFRERSRGDRLLFFCLAGLVLQYALLEQAKFYIYWMPVVPFLCIGIAGVLLWLLQPPRWDPLRLAGAGVAALALLVFFGEGSVARLSGIRTAPDATNYARLADEIHEYVPEGSRVVGSTSLWWGMRDTDYRSYFMFFYLTRPDAGEDKKTISQFLSDFDPQYLVLTRLATGELEQHLTPGDYGDWQTYMSQHARKIARIEGPVVIRAYGFIDIWQFD